MGLAFVASSGFVRSPSRRPWTTAGGRRARVTVSRTNAWRVRAEIQPTKPNASTATENPHLSDEGDGTVTTKLLPEPEKDDGVPGLANGPDLGPRVLLGEFIATFIFVYLTVCNASTSTSGVASAAAGGAIVAAVAASFIPISGAHFNPAVTLALAATGRVPLTRAIAFVPLQLVAAALATFASSWAGGVSVAAGFAGIPESAAGLELLQACFAEVVPISIIVAVLFQTAVASKREGAPGIQLAPLYIGLTVFACASTFPGVFNPARAFGPAFFLQSWSHHWVYWMPVPAAILTAIFFEHVFLAPTTGRRPMGWLAQSMAQAENLTATLKTVGTAGLIAYGAMNILYYVPALTIAWISVRLCRNHPSRPLSPLLSETCPMFFRFFFAFVC